MKIFPFLYIRRNNFCQTVLGIRDILVRIRIRIRIRTTELRIRILLFLSVADKNRSFLLRNVQPPPIGTEIRYFDPVLDYSITRISGKNY